MSDRYDQMELYRLQAEARDREISIVFKNKVQLRKALRDSDKERAIAQGGAKMFRFREWFRLHGVGLVAVALGVAVGSLIWVNRSAISSLLVRQPTVAIETEPVAAVATERSTLAPTQTPYVVVVTAMAEAESIAEETESEDEGRTTVVLITPPDGSVLLGKAGDPNGFFFVLTSGNPAKVPVVEGGFTLVACGNCTVGDLEVTSDGTEGNVVLLLGVEPDGSTPKDLNSNVWISDYTAGHVGVTVIFPDKEDPREAAFNAVNTMLTGEGNCGDAACNTVFLYTVAPNGKLLEKETFTDPD